MQPIRRRPIAAAPRPQAPELKVTGTIVDASTIWQERAPVLHLRLKLDGPVDQKMLKVPSSAWRDMAVSIDVDDHTD